MRDLFFAIHSYFIYPVLSLIFFVLIAYVVMSWLFSFGIVSPRQPTARGVWQFLSSVIEPMVRPIRRLVPPLGQLDLSILILGLVLLFLRDFAIPRAILALPG